MAGLKVSSFFLLLLSGCALADNSSYINAGQAEFTEHFTLDKDWQEDGFLKLQLKEAPFQVLFDQGCDLDIELIYTRESHTSIFRMRARGWGSLKSNQFMFDFKSTLDHSLILTYETILNSCKQDPKFVRRYTLDFNIDKWLRQNKNK